jgi:hypothetical protein
MNDQPKERHAIEPEVSIVPPGVPSSTQSTENTLIHQLTGGRAKKYRRFVIAALGSLPWIGGVLAAAASLSAERDQEKVNELQKLWLEEHREKMRDLGAAFVEIFSRLDNFGEEVQGRIESPEYLALVKKAFRGWDEADTQDKKDKFKKLITNAGAIALCPDDLIRLFLSWIEQYHEAHFMVIKEIYKNPSTTRAQIWDKIHGQRPREDSPEADLFRYLIRDLSTGGVIRQARDTDSSGRFVKREWKAPSQASGDRVMESAFEETKPYVLTGLGKQFVHYVMEDVVPQIGGTQRPNNANG